jgi:hypothetical protein
LFGFADASLAVLPRVSRVRAPPATRSTTGRPRRLAFLSPRPTGGPAPTSPASEPLFRSGRNFLTWWPTRRRVRPPSFVALRRRRPVRRRFRRLPPNRPNFRLFPVRFSTLTFRPTGPDRRRSRRRVGRLRPRPSDVVSTGVAAGFSNRRRKTPFLPVFPRFSDFLSPADRPLRVGDESRLAPRRAPTPGVRRREPCALLGWEFLRGAKDRFSPTLGAPPESPFPRTLSGCRFSSLPPRRSPTAKTASESDPVWRFYLSEAAEFRTFCCVTRIPATVTVAHRELCWRPAGRRSPPASAHARSRPDVQPTTTSSSPNRK